MEAHAAVTWGDEMSARSRVIEAKAANGRLPGGRGQTVCRRDKSYGVIKGNWSKRGALRKRSKRGDVD